ncbi:NADH dehydrogenase [ubiquinone] 1 alpha subcomplex assembly factor 1 [Marchantia polymorpha subsp. ruderalis]
MAVSGAACLANSALSSPQIPVKISSGSLGVYGRSSDFLQFAENSLSSSTSLGQPRRKLRVVRQGYGQQHVVLAAGSDSDKKPWDLGRFIRTYTFYNEPFNLSKVFEFVSARLSGSSEEKPSSGMEKEVVLVTGATGGTGKRVLTLLQSKGIPVRALVRNVEKARSLLGPDVELVVADVTQKSTLLPEYFKGVRQVINCVSVIVGPKEGDNSERQKYMQGIKFFDPEIKGDSPETVEFKGLQNLIEAVKENVGVRDGVSLYTVTEKGPAGPAWGSLDDVVMGGVSESSMQLSLNGGENGGPVGLFKGVVSTSNNGGFASIRTRNFSEVQDLSAYEGIEMRIKGNGRRFKLIIRLSADWDAIGYTLSFDTAYNEWQTIRLPFKDFIPVFRAKSVKDAPPFDRSQITSLQLLYSKFEYDGALNPSFETGPFELPIASIKSYMKEPIKPRFVHVGSAGVTRPDRPGLDLSKQPPAVRLNKELDYILTYKLKGEDAIRDSGIPYAIIRPCALTEEPAGAELIFEQGDNITGKVGREEIARICIAALDSPAATDTTFEVKSTVPFSQPFEIDPSNPPPERDYAEFFATLKPGITGKEALEQQEPIPV